MARTMTAGPEAPEDVPTTFSVHPYQQNLGKAHVTKPGSRSGSGSSGGPSLRRERSMKSREFGLFAPRAHDSKHTLAPAPAPASASPSSPASASSSFASSLRPHDHRDENVEYDYDNGYYRSSSHTTTTTPSTNYLNTYPRSPTFRVRAGSASPQIPTAPVSPVSHRWDSLSNGSSTLYNQSLASAPTSPIANASPSVSPIPHNDPHRSIDSIASETRDEFPTLPATKVASTDNSILVENFSRPRNPSIKQPYYEGTRLRSTNQSHPDPNQLDVTNGHPVSWPRSRGQSISSNKSSSTFASLPARPSPDIHSRDSPRGRGRQPPPTRPLAAYNRAESAGPAQAREPLLHRMASMPTDEPRSSFRSQLSASTAQGTLGTERSSVLTKSSSVTSVYGQVDDQVDEALSVEDVMGMYEKGFGDDSLPEDNEDDESRPPTGKSESSKRRTAVLEAMDDPLPMPRSAATFPGPRSDAIVRDSAAIFRNSNLTNSLPAEIGASTTDPKDDFQRPRLTRRQTAMTTTDADDRDRYGFRKSNQYVTQEQYDEWNHGYTDYLARRRKKWNLFLKDNELMTDTPNRFPPRSAKTKRFVRKGIPPEWRGAAWFYYAGGPAILSKHSGLYDTLLKQEVKDVDYEAIERDLHRTFPDNIKFRSSQPAAAPGDTTQTRNSGQTVKDPNGSVREIDEKPMISSLRRVLHAFSVYNPRIGYCQSLNFLAGLLLLFVETEEQAFWLLNIITRVYLPGTHEMSLEGANVDLGVLMSSLRDAMPGVWAKIGGELDGTDAVRPKNRRQKYMGEPTRLPPITLCMTAWFMSCFIGTLPIETTLRVWDVFFYEGSKTLFRIALCIFKLGESEIRTVGDPMEIFQVVQTIPRRLIDANGLMESCFKRRNGFGHLSQDTIEQKRQERRTLVKAEREKLALGKTVPTEVNDVKRKGTLFTRRKGRSNPAEVM
ncbi:Uu.00g008190.m01.CDS01 [Anthostomella pinea]|uniref:Uu.00g008190.m01.CDS01 n=1 Tax=Anthostomella pinea TaxID=933095 RepID=A0AAI8VXS9_9PEZI|nr:Uu.00g008190.m01.CDS01 [Anthostomella pinea]